MVIAIDGFSSCGKSTLAKDLSLRLNFSYVDSGAMYRAVTHYFIQHNVDIQNQDDVLFHLKNIFISYQSGSMLFNGVALDKELRSPLVAELVSPVAAISSVRSKLVHWQRQCGRDGNIVMDGRDIGTVVFPHADYKFFVTASLEIRAQRRFMELKEQGLEVSLEDVVANLNQRDYIDSTRTDSPLKKAADAIEIDTTHLNRAQQLELALSYIEKQG